MSDLKLKLVVSICYFVDRQANHAALFDLSARCVTEAALRDDDYQVFVTEPLRDFLE